MVCLPVSLLTTPHVVLSVHFLVDTGNPWTFLSKETLTALNGVNDFMQIKDMNVNIWGTEFAINISTSNWKDINLLGANYLKRANLKLECAYDYDSDPS
jgi:hypothetical protein